MRHLEMTGLDFRRPLAAGRLSAAREAVPGKIELLQNVRLSMLLAAVDRMLAVASMELCPKAEGV